MGGTSHFERTMYQASLAQLNMTMAHAHTHTPPHEGTTLCSAVGVGKEKEITSLEVEKSSNFFKVSSNPDAVDAIIPPVPASLE